MDAKRSQGPQLARGRPRGASACLQSMSEDLRTRATGRVSSGLKAGRLEPQEELMFQAESVGWERPRWQLRGEAERVPSYSCNGRPCSSQDFNELDEAYPPWGWGEFRFIQSTHSDVHRIRQQPPRHTQNDV